MQQLPELQRVHVVPSIFVVFSPFCFVNQIIVGEVVDFENVRVLLLIFKIMLDRGDTFSTSSEMPRRLRVSRKICSNAILHIKLQFLQCDLIRIGNCLLGFYIKQHSYL